MVALLSFMTSLALVTLGLGFMGLTLRGQGAKIVAALAGQRMSANVIALPARPRQAARVTAAPYRALPEWRAAA